MMAAASRSGCSNNGQRKNGYDRERVPKPFVIGVAGGTASGKVRPVHPFPFIRHTIQDKHTITLRMYSRFCLLFMILDEIRFDFVSISIFNK
jgi:hypothetical protein